MAPRNTTLAIKIYNFIGNMPSLSFNISKTKSHPYWYIFTNIKGISWCNPTLRFKKVQRWFIFSVCDKPNICTVSKLGKFAFVYGKIVNINQIVEANSETSLYTWVDQKVLKLVAYLHKYTTELHQTCTVYVTTISWFLNVVRMTLYARGYMTSSFDDVMHQWPGVKNVRNCLFHAICNHHL